VCVWCVSRRCRKERLAREREEQAAARNATVCKCIIRDEINCERALTEKLGSLGAWHAERSRGSRPVEPWVAQSNRGT
jgi:hypothetical protein